MSIQKAFDILTKELGDDFKFKDRLNDFMDAIISKETKLKEFSNFIKGLYPDAKYLDFTAEYDSINRINRLCEYEIKNDTKLFVNDDFLRINSFQIHSKIFNYIGDTMLGEVEPDAWLDETLYRFYLDNFEFGEYDEE